MRIENSTVFLFSIYFDNFQNTLLPNTGNKLISTCKNPDNLQYFFVYNDSKIQYSNNYVNLITINLTIQWIYVESTNICVNYQNYDALCRRGIPIHVLEMSELFAGNITILS